MGLKKISYQYSYTIFAALPQLLQLSGPGSKSACALSCLISRAGTNYASSSTSSFCSRQSTQCLPD